MSNPTVLSFADLGPDGQTVAEYMTWGMAAAIDDDTASAILTIPDRYRVQWATEKGGLLAKTLAFITAQPAPPLASLPKRRQVAAFLTIRALIEAAPKKWAGTVQTVLGPDRAEAC